MVESSYKILRSYLEEKQFFLLYFPDLSADLLIERQQISVIFLIGANERVRIEP